MSIFNKQPYKDGNSDWNTPASVWDIVIPYIPNDKTIWMPFYNDGYCGEYLTSKGFNVIHNNEDFWENNHGDICVDNPPYKCEGIVKTKEKIIKRLVELDKPFMLLIPTTTLQTAYYKKIHNEDFQVLIPQTKYNFEKFVGDKTKCPFYTLWLCYKVGLEKDFNII